MLLKIPFIRRRIALDYTLFVSLFTPSLLRVGEESDVLEYILAFQKIGFCPTIIGPNFVLLFALDLSPHFEDTDLM